MNLTPIRSASIVAGVVAFVLAGAAATSINHGGVPEPQVRGTAPSLTTPRSIGPVRPVAVLAGHTGLVDTVEYSQSGARVVSASVRDGTIRIWDASSGLQLGVVRPTQPWDRVAIDHVHLWFAVGFTDGVVHVYDQHGEELASFDGGTPLAFSADGTLLATSDGVWNTVGPSLRWPSPDPLQSAVFSRDSTMVAVETAAAVQVHDARSGAFRWTSTSANGASAVDRLVLSADGSRVARSIVFDTANGTVVDGNLPTTDLLHLALSPDGQWAALAYRSGGLALLDLRHGDAQLPMFAEPRASGREITAVAFSPDGTLLATRTSNGLTMRDAPTGVVRWFSIADVAAPGGIHATVDFAPDGKHVVTSNGGAPQIFTVAAP